MAKIHAWIRENGVDRLFHLFPMHRLNDADNSSYKIRTRRKSMKKKKRFVIGALFFLIIAAALTNPTEHDYRRFSNEQIGMPVPLGVKIDRINFYVFSTYAPLFPMDHHGTVHLGFMNHFYQISDGQYDYPRWLELFTD
jgi:hypothetical protein